MVMLKMSLQRAVLNNRKRLLLGMGAVLLIIAGYITYSMLTAISPAERQNKIVTLNEEAIKDENFKAAAEKQIEAFNLIDDKEGKAIQARDIGGSFESARDYDNALKWYKESLHNFESLKDEDSVKEVKDNIERVESYKRPQQPQPEGPTDGGM